MNEKCRSLAAHYGIAACAMVEWRVPNRTTKALEPQVKEFSAYLGTQWMWVEDRNIALMMKLADGVTV